VLVDLFIEKIGVVKDALSRHVQEFGTGAARSKEGLNKEEEAALKVPQGIVAVLLGDLGGDGEAVDEGADECVSACPTIPSSSFP
jgi:hypothetical protein